MSILILATPGVALAAYLLSVFLSAPGGREGDWRRDRRPYRVRLAEWKEQHQRQPS